MFSECPEINASNCDGCLTNERGCAPNQCNSAGKCEVSDSFYLDKLISVLMDT